MDQSEAQRGHEPQAAGQPVIDVEAFRDNFRRAVLRSGQEATLSALGMPEPDLSPLVPDPAEYLREQRMRGRLLALNVSGVLRNPEARR